MVFPEFLEFIGRLAEFKFKGTQDNDMALSWKIEQLLEQICPYFGLVKNDVIIVEENNSESDNDY